MQPAVGVHGYSLAFIFLDADGLSCIFKELQKSRDSHVHRILEPLEEEGKMVIL